VTAGPKRLRSLTIVAVLAVAALAASAEFRSGPIAFIGLVQIQAYQPGAIKVVFLPSEQGGEATGNTRKDLHPEMIHNKLGKYKCGDMAR
jgi:hypothetical protein